MVPRKNTVKEVSFEWSHHRILLADSKVRTTQHVSLIDSETLSSANIEGAESVYVVQAFFWWEFVVFKIRSYVWPPSCISKT